MSAVELLETLGANPSDSFDDLSVEEKEKISHYLASSSRFDNAFLSIQEPEPDEEPAPEPDDKVEVA